MARFPRGKTVQRYAEAYGGPMPLAFLWEADIGRAVTAFCTATVDNATGARRNGRMMAAAVLGQSERVNEIGAYVALGLAASAEALAAKFQAE